MELSRRLTTLLLAGFSSVECGAAIAVLVVSFAFGLGGLLLLRGAFGILLGQGALILCLGTIPNGETLGFLFLPLQLVLLFSGHPGLAETKPPGWPYAYHSVRSFFDGR